MASIRKRPWTASSGEQKTAWVVDYRDASGARRNKQFSRKKDAEAWLVATAWEVKQGLHTPDTQSITLFEAANLWLERRRTSNLEPTTIAAYDQHIRLHINPLCGALRLNQITRPMAEDLRDQLVARLSKPMALRVLRTLSSIVDEAQSRGRVAQNVFAKVKIARGKRDKAKVIIPSKRELRAVLRAANDHDNLAAGALVALLIFSGLRASELRGLAWRHVDFRRKTLSVQQRADSHNVIGSPKSDTGTRSIPLADVAVSALRKWKLSCPATELDLVFPSEGGRVISNHIMTQKLLHPVQIKAGVVVRNGAGDEVGRYTLHDFRHAAASLWIDRGTDAKRIQRWMGHSSIQITFDTYGHLFHAPARDAAVAADVQDDLLRDDDEVISELTATIMLLPIAA